MVGMRGSVFFTLAAATAACGIGVAGVDPSPVSGLEGSVTLPDGAVIPPGTDGGSQLADGSVAPRDSGGDANVVTPIDGGCLRIIDDSFTGTSLDARWKLAGNAKFQNGQVELTQSGDYMGKGALWWSDTLVFGTTLTAVFHYSQLVEAPHNPGVGIGIGWVKSNSTWKTGDQGLNVGICYSGLDGVAASLRLAGTTRLDAIVGVAGECGTNGGYTPIDPFDLASGVLTMKLTKTQVTATTASHSTNQGGAVPTSGVIGFTASTGTESAGEGRLAVTHAIVEVCP